jgi:hypothetical protein
MVFNWCRDVRACGVRTIGAGKVGERDNVVSLMSVVVVVNGRVVVSCECDECDDLVIVMS